MSKKDPLVTVSGDLMSKAFNMYCRAQPETVYLYLCKSFFQLSGARTFLLSNHRVTPEQAERVKQMACEHGFAYCKMMIAKDLWKLP